MSEPKTKRKTKDGKAPPRFRRIIDWFLKGTLHHYGNELAERHGRISGRIFDSVFDQIRIDPEKVEKLRRFAEKGRLIYALPYRSPLDFLFLNVRLRYAGLPMPEIAYNMKFYRFQPVSKVFRVVVSRIIHLISYRSWPDPYRNKYYLKRYKEGAGFVLSVEDPGSFAHRISNPTHDPLYHLIKLHKKHDEPVIIIPLFPVFERGPMKEGGKITDIFFGPKSRPGRLRKIVHYLRYSGHAFLEVADPITISMFLEREDQKGLTDEKVAFNLRKELWEHAVREQRVIRGPAQKPRTQLMESVLRDPEVLKVMRQESKKQQKPFRVIRNKTARYVDEIAADYSQSTIEFLNIMLGWVWDNLYDGVHVEKHGLERVREASKRYPVVYVPSHKSHIDYLIMSWVLYNNNMVPPHIVAGVNLNTWPIGPILRKGGAFFMRRSFRDNPTYKSVFTKYTETLIKEGYNIEFFIEGGRSRTGRLLPPTMGMVKYVVDAFEKGVAKDIMVVPVYIGYDQIIEEGEYLQEMSGTKSPKGNVAELFRNWKLIKQRYGRIYVNLAKPISLRQHLEQMTDQAGDLEEPEWTKEVTTEMAGKIIQGINRNQVVTSYAIMSAALLTSPAKAITRSELLNALMLFYQYLEGVGAQFAEGLDNFGKAMEDVIGFFEQRKLIEVEEPEEEGEEHIFTLPEDHRLSLEMYKNMILHFFLPMNFVTMSLLSADYGECSDTKLRDDYSFLKDLFRNEFIHDDRKTEEEKMDFCLDFLESGRQIESERVDGHRVFKVAPKGREEMVYFAAMLTNFLEAYGIVLNTLPSLSKKQENERDFLNRTKRAGNRLYKQGQVLRPEALSLLVYKNAVKMAQDTGLVEKVDGEGKYPLLRLDPEKEDKRNQMLTHISKFIRVEKYHYLEK